MSLEQQEWQGDAWRMPDADSLWQAGWLSSELLLRFSFLACADSCETSEQPFSSVGGSGDGR